MPLDDQNAPHDGPDGCFYGAGRTCWNAAIAAQSCTQRAKCPRIH